MCVFNLIYAVLIICYFEYNSEKYSKLIILGLSVICFTNYRLLEVIENS